jgi:galactokinase
VKAYAPGRVNLIGDHTDYTGGLVLPMAIDRGTTIEGSPTACPEVRLTSADESGAAVVPLDITDPASIEPLWARYVAGVVSVLRPRTGFIGSVESTLPLGAGLSSSSSLTVATALALGFEGSSLSLARACQRAEQTSSRVPGGIMDQLVAAAGRAGHAILIDCSTLAMTPVPLPTDLDVIVVHSGIRRALVGTAYTERRAQCEAAERALNGRLRDATVTDTRRLSDPLLRRRARHVVTENQRVRAFADALRVGDAATAGATMVESHVSLRVDFEVSTPELDALVERLTHTPGVLGARLTGAGFGGCVVALAERGAVLDVDGWRVQAADGAWVENP